MMSHKSACDLISVIIPVYKAEEYLDCCIESIVKQTYKNLEIILVDDGSPDNCPRMCDEWQARDDRIKVIHTANGGSARARNIALRMASGKYISFCDSDDMMRMDMLEILHKVAVDEQADIVECDYSTSKDVVFTPFDRNNSINVYDAESALKHNIQGTFFSSVIWNKLYKTSTIESIFFVEQKTIDDEFWTYRAIGNAGKIALICRKMYYYRQQSNSVMHQPYSSKRLAAIEAHVERHEYIMKQFPLLSKKSLVRLWFDCRYHGQMIEKNLSGDEKMKCYQYMDSILEKYPLKWGCIAEQSCKEKVWLIMEKISLPITCKIRNVLNIGL